MDIYLPLAQAVILVGVVLAITIIASTVSIKIVVDGARREAQLRVNRLVDKVREDSKKIKREANTVAANGHHRR